MQSTILDAPYGAYLGLTQLFELQGDQAALHHPDEMQFRTVHLVSELWLRLVNQEMSRITTALDACDWLLASRLLERCNAALALLNTQLGLLETMLVADYNAFRGALGNASGLQSPGYLAIRQASKPLAQAFKTAYEQHADEPSLAFIREALLSFDMAFQRFLLNHWQIAKRFIGDGGAGTGGQGVDYLRGGIDRSLFSTIWKA